MFDGLTNRLGDIFDRLSKRGALSESDVTAAMREVRIALLEADVALPVAKDFISKVKEKAIGAEVLRSVKPGQQVIKIVHDELVAMLGASDEEKALVLTGEPPIPYLMVGLQGSGKTTTTGKIAKRLKEKHRKKVLMASLDTRRPAAQEQLRILGEQIGVDTLEIIEGQQPVAITERALDEGRIGGYDIVMLDTAGRLSIDEELMAEVEQVAKVAKPQETLLLVDAMTGQDAVTVADNFAARVKLTGVVMTRIDGDARGGAALSMRAVTGCPIKLLGVGEKMDALEAFHADRIAGRILGMGDVVSLVERAAETIDQEEAQAMAAKLQKGKFDMNDLAAQLRQMKKMGGLGGMLSFMPGVGKIKEQLDSANIDESILNRQEAIISSMTKKERAYPALIKASRKKRIAAGSGVTVQEVNKLLKQFQQMQTMVKKIKKMGKKGLMGSLFGKKMPDMSELENMSPDQLQNLQNLPPELKGQLGGSGPLPGLGGAPFLPGKGKK